MKRIGIAIAFFATGLLVAYLIGTRHTVIDVNQYGLFERDPESWSPRVYGSSPFRLDASITPQLEIAVGERRRFNPQLFLTRHADNVRDLTIFISFPRAIFAARDAVVLPIALPNGARWKVTEDRPQQDVVAYLQVGDIVKGYVGAPNQQDVFYLTPSTAGTAMIRYHITGLAVEANQALHVRRSFTVRAIAPRS